MDRCRRLILAPHADDETIGCGGLLAKYWDECGVAVLTRPSAEREQELNDARRILGYSPLHLSFFQDGRLDADPAELVREVDGLLHETRPEELYLPFPSPHQDHVATYEAGIRAARLSMQDDHWYVPTVLVYDVATYDLSLYPTALPWNLFESLTAEQVDRKVRACQAYRSQVPTGHHPMSGIAQAAAAVGHGRRVEYAERYSMVRSVR